MLADTCNIEAEPEAFDLFEAAVTCTNAKLAGLTGAAVCKLD